MYGNDLYRFLYEPANKYTTDKIIKTIISMIETWEPRISITDIPVTVDEDDGTYYIKIMYYIPGLKKEDTFDLNLSKI